MGTVASHPPCHPPSPGAAARFHWSSVLPISPQQASSKQPIRLARAWEAAPRGWGGASQEAGRAAAWGSGFGSGLKGSIFAAAAAAATLGQVKRTLSVLLAVCSVLLPPDESLPAAPLGASGLVERGIKSVLPGYLIFVTCDGSLSAPTKRFRSAVMGTPGSP